MSYDDLGGEFGAMMQVHIQNDGPVTLQFETPNLPPAKEVYKEACLNILVQLGTRYHCGSLII